VNRLFAIIFVALLTTTTKEGDVAASYKQAAELAAALEKERDTQAYIHLDLMPYYQEKYSPVFQSCLESTDHPDTSSFSFAVAIGKDGRVLRLYVDHETNIYTCVRETLKKDEFPHPPLAPYYMHVKMSFSNN
jgi:hypothetical protein